VQAALLTACVAAGGCALWWVRQGGFDLAVWLPITAGSGAVLGYLAGPRIGYLFIYS
jgi:hypothetical protein